MQNALLQKMIDKNQRTDLPEFRPGDTIRVHVRIREGDKERLQAFEGVVIARNNAGMGETITVRKISFGQGVERIFPVTPRDRSDRRGSDGRFAAPSCTTCVASGQGRPPPRARLGVPCRWPAAPGMNVPHAQGVRYIAGVDEVGRGCAFRPVFAAAVVLDPERPIRGLRDSKELDAETPGGARRTYPGTSDLPGRSAQPTHSKLTGSTSSRHPVSLCGVPSAGLRRPAIIC